MTRNALTNRAKGPIPREVDRPSPADREAVRGRERPCAKLLMREDDTFPAKSSPRGPPRGVADAITWPLRYPFPCNAGVRACPLMIEYRADRKFQTQRYDASAACSCGAAEMRRSR